jgi:predicted metal-binding membrane protein
MWVVMMVAMMLPSLVPMLRCYRQAVAWTSARHLGALTAIAGAGYFFVWTVCGMAVFPLGARADREQLMNEPNIASRFVSHECCRACQLCSTRRL